MWQFELKVVLQNKYGESSRPPFFTFTLADDEESLRLKLMTMLRPMELVFTYLVPLFLVELNKGAKLMP